MGWYGAGAGWVGVSAGSGLVMCRPSLWHIVTHESWWPQEGIANIAPMGAGGLGGKP